MKKQLINSKLRTIAKATALFLFLALLSACDSDSSGKSKNSPTDNNNNSGSTTPTPNNGIDDNAVIPSNYGTVNSQRKSEENFITTLNGPEDFTFWGCEFIAQDGKDYILTLSLLEDNTGNMFLFDAEAEQLASLEDAIWVADSSDMLIFNLEENGSQLFENYIFSDDFNWTAEVQIEENEYLELECALYDQDGFRV